MNRCALKYLCLTAILFLMASCSVYKYVPEGEYLLHRVTVSNDSLSKIENLTQYHTLSYQKPNSKWLGMMRIPLRLYSMSKQGDQPNGKRKGLFSRIGEKPVLLDSMLCASSAENMRRSLFNAGYLKASVDWGIVHYSKKPKADVHYVLHPGLGYTIAGYHTDIYDAGIDSILDRLKAESLVTVGMKLDADKLNEERERIVDLLQTRGYYDLNKENISYVADTIQGSNEVNLTMHLGPFATTADGDSLPYPVFSLDTVTYVVGGNSSFALNIEDYIRVEDEGNVFYYYNDSDGKIVLRPKVIRNHSFLTRGRIYDSRAVSRTYNSLSNIGGVKYSNIRFRENLADSTLRPVVLLTMYPRHSFSAELEGTNTAGDLGVAAKLSLTNRNLFGSGEKLTLSLRGAFEAISDLPGYSGNSYVEYGIEANLEFPRLLFPFIKSEFQRRSQAVSQLTFMLNSQNRPEFSKMVITYDWSYLWNLRRHSHRIEIPNINFLYVPWISEEFRKQYLDPIDDRRSILRYNYEDMLIFRAGYTYYYSNSNTSNTRQNKRLTISLKATAESAGNLLYGISKLAKSVPDEKTGQYHVLGVPYAQYVKSDGSFTMNWKIDKWNNLVFHTEYGFAYPYSNSESVPFEKRYYSGGANSVRGWAVRELGPGVYHGEKDAVNYIKQAGDIKLGCSLELRTHLFWKMNLALFADAGNIWTIKDYEEQPGGMFHLDTFYKEFGAACGLGLRLDLNFLVFRVDWGKQIVNPAYDRSTPEYFPLVNKVDYRSYAFHFAIGYPF